MSCYSAWNTLWNSQSPCKPQPIQHIFDFQIVYISRSFQVMLYVFEIIAVSLTSSWCWTCTAYYNILLYAFFLQKQDSSRLTTWWIHLMFEIDLNCTLSFPAMLSKKRMRRTQKIIFVLVKLLCKYIHVTHIDLKKLEVKFSATWIFACFPIPLALIELLNKAEDSEAVTVTSLIYSVIVFKIILA